MSRWLAAVRRAALGTEIFPQMIEFGHSRIMCGTADHPVLKVMMWRQANQTESTA